MNTDKDFQDAMNRIAARLLDKIRAEMWNKKLVDTGELLNSFESKIEGNDILILSNAYLPYAEFGRGAGKVPYDFANIIAMWAARKGIHLNKGTYQDFGWAVTQKTKKYGSARYRGDRPKEDVLIQPLVDIMNETIDEVSTDIRNITVSMVIPSPTAIRR